MKNEPRGLIFFMKPRGRFQPRNPKFIHISLTLTLHPHTPHTVTLQTLSLFTPKIQTLPTHLAPRHSVKPTPILTTLTLPHTSPHTQIQSNSHQSLLSLKTSHHATSSLKPVLTITHTQTYTGPRNLSLFKPNYNQTQTSILGLSLFKPRTNWPRHSSNPHSHFASCHYLTSPLFKTRTTTQPQFEGRYPFSICLLWLDLNNFFIY